MNRHWYKFALDKAEEVMPSLEPDDRDSLKQGIEFLVQGQMLAQTEPERAAEDLIAGAFLIGTCVAYTDSTRAFLRGPAFSGVLSGKARHVEAEETWLPHALELAGAIQAETGGLVQARLAEEIVARWSLKIHCPETQLVKAISRWQRDGKLAKRNKR